MLGYGRQSACGQQFVVVVVAVVDEYSASDRAVASLGWLRSDTYEGDDTYEEPKDLSDTYEGLEDTYEGFACIPHVQWYG